MNNTILTDNKEIETLPRCLNESATPVRLEIA